MLYWSFCFLQSVQDDSEATKLKVRKPETISRTDYLKRDPGPEYAGFEEYDDLNCGRLPGSESSCGWVTLQQAATRKQAFLLMCFTVGVVMVVTVFQANYKNKHSA